MAATRRVECDMRIMCTRMVNYDGKNAKGVTHAQTLVIAYLHQHPPDSIMGKKTTSAYTSTT